MVKKEENFHSVQLDILAFSFAHRTVSWDISTYIK